MFLQLPLMSTSHCTASDCSCVECIIDHSCSDHEYCKLCDRPLICTALNCLCIDCSTRKNNRKFVQALLAYHSEYASEIIPHIEKTRHLPNVDVNYVDTYGNTPLLYVVQLCSGALPMCQYLVECNADVNYAGMWSRTALHYACIRNLPLVEFLVDNNADVNIRDYFGTTPLMTAAKFTIPKPDIITYLIDHGANSTLTNYPTDLCPHGQRAANMTLHQSIQDLLV